MQIAYTQYPMAEIITELLPLCYKVIGTKDDWVPNIASSWLK